MENLIKKIEELREKIIETMRILDIDGQRSEVRELSLEVQKKDFWDNQERAVEISKNLEDLEKEISKWDELLLEVRDMEEFVAVAQKEGDMTIEDDSNARYEELKKKFSDLEFLVLFSGKHDKKNAVLSIHAGTGGVDAQDWAEILERMFMRFVENKGWKLELLDRNVSGEAGVKSVSMRILGRWAYGNLRSESGVHRLVRISPFDAEHMRHTSFALVEVIPELPEAHEVLINDNDLKIDVYKSSGPGGQSVNTTDSAVRITHLPTKIVVTCQNERSQHQNKEKAMNILKSKLYRFEEEKKEAEERKARGEAQKAEWGKQIRSYVMHPYKMVKDHRTDHETQEIDKVLNGDLNGFIEAYLKKVRQ